MHGGRKIFHGHRIEVQSPSKTVRDAAPTSGNAVLNLTSDQRRARLEAAVQSKNEEPVSREAAKGAGLAETNHDFRIASVCAFVRRLTDELF